MPPPTPKKPSATEKKTAQTGLMPELDAPRPGYVTPKKKTGTEDDDLTDSPVKSVEAEPPTKEEFDIAATQDEFVGKMKEARGQGRKSRKHKKSKKTRKTRKVKKHGKRRA